jgi:hypothetical protein
MTACCRPDCVCKLPTSEAFLLWALRQWRAELVQWERERAVPAGGSPLRRGFETARIQGALADFALAMETLMGSRGRPTDVRPTTCPSISHDEAALIELFGLAQNDARTGLLCSLNSMMPPIEAISASISLRSVGTALAAAGLRLAVPTRSPGASLH